MAAFDVNAQREALASQIKAGIGRPVNAFGGYVPDVPDGPCIIMWPSDQGWISFEDTLKRPLVRCNWDVWVLVPAGPSGDGQRILGELCSAGSTLTNSVREAIASDKHLGGTADGGSRVIGVDYRGRFSGGRPDSQPDFDWAVIFVETLHHAL